VTLEAAGGGPASGPLAGAALVGVCGRVEAYYADKLARHGARPRGVDWEDAATQQLRFAQLLKICPFDRPFSLIDLGCGYGAMLAFLADRHPEAHVDYLGIDLSPDMVKRAERRHKGRRGARFLAGSSSAEQADYVVASGIMNVMVGHSRPLWERFVRTMLMDMDRMARRGFAVNFLKPQPGDPDQEGRLYRCDAVKWARFIEDRLGRPVEILGGYGLGEVTLLARGRKKQQQKHPGRRRATATRDRVREAALSVISPEGHLDDGRLHRALALLRAEAPVYWVECPGMRPFWLLTRHADVTAVERRGAPFIAAPRSVLSTIAGEAAMRQVSGRPEVLRSLFQMDLPEHRAYRNVATPWFSPTAIAKLESLVSRSAEAAVARVAGRRETFDFMAEVAVPFPLRVMAHILGLPAADDASILKWARGLTGAEDPDRALADHPAESMRLAGVAFRDYFNAVTADRQACPRHDLSTAISAARVNGKPMPEYERLSYFMQLAIAGQENTGYSLGGGLLALIEHRAAFDRLKAEPALLRPAVEEMLRWTSPGRLLVRTATENVAIGNKLISPGESVALFFASANRDETVFEAADSFRIDRQPNPHLAFGLGHHFCLGAHLARMELRALFAALLPRLRRVSLAGPVRRARSAVISGVSSLPVRCDWA
jgi:cytochrome P450